MASSRSNMIRKSSQSEHVVPHSEHVHLPQYWWLMLDNHQYYFLGSCHGIIRRFLPAAGH
jgi:hypothetical protein